MMRSMSALLLLPLAACGAGAPDLPATDAAPPPEAAVTRGADVAEARRSWQELRRPFWQEGELVEQLGLTDDVLSIMETRRQATLERRRERLRRATEQRAELAAALEVGAWDEARRLAEALAADARAAIEADLELKIGILDLLTPEQRRLLQRERPSALRRSWLLPSGRPATGANPLLDPPAET